MTEVITTHSVKETENFAKQIASELFGGETLLLRGDLGSGKTTFTQGVAKALGIARRITSPTFIIMRSYSLHRPAGSADKLFHIDLYRTNSENDLEDLGLLELIGQEDNIVIIEWPEKLGSKSPKNARVFDFEFISENTRRITVNN